MEKVEAKCSILQFLMYSRLQWSRARRMPTWEEGPASYMEAAQHWGPDRTESFPSKWTEGSF